ncbi:hypothetical protein Pla110_42380 [Polystyrenella longa]|uniref:Uncharacterized protein n=1 Tax=Polystyrenella longa TaxID=2528007 RepID=A0A518CTC3_9PLAN|nr:hypothetical protein [Polystyrenella longa]QDU82480.1 hypothetical protein Pla110_42380 [Polystyrenella longa]
MGFPPSMNDALSVFGSTATEIHCNYPDEREFVSLIMYNPGNDPFYFLRFPFLLPDENNYRLRRYRVLKQNIDSNKEIIIYDLIEVQTLNLPTFEAVSFILNQWGVPINSFGDPRKCDAPL